MKKLRTICATLALALPFGPALAGDRTAQAAVDMAMAAIDRGLGQMCSLSNQPVPAGGYWPCVDTGPYRFVKEYGKVRGFVILKDQTPYPILIWQDGEAEFTTAGPWSRDMGPRMAAWWDEEVMGGRQRRETAKGEDGRREAAEGVIRGMDGSAGQGQAPAASQEPASEPVTPPSAAAAPPAAPVPQAQRQATETTPGAALRDRPIPTRQGGVEIAPGVVRYPPGPR